MIKEFDRVFLSIARPLEGLFRLAGEEEEAESAEPSPDGPAEEELDSAAAEVAEEASRAAES